MMSQSSDQKVMLRSEIKESIFDMIATGKLLRYCHRQSKISYFLLRLVAIQVFKCLKFFNQSFILVLEDCNSVF